MLDDFFLGYIDVCSPQVERELTVKKNTILKINFMGFVTGAEGTHSHLYYGEFPWLPTGSYTTGKSCPKSFFTVKGRLSGVS